MPEHILFVTGKLAEPQLHKVLQGMQPTPFTYRVHELGLSVAALMTTDMIERRLSDSMGADRVLLPGRCSGDVPTLAAHLGVPVARGPDELKDLPAYFGRGGAPPDLSRYDVRVFAEIVDAPELTVEQILARAQSFRDSGADVIDLGCLPAKLFPHLEDAVQTLRAEGFQVSVDSMDTQELKRGAGAGAHYLLSLKEDTSWIADEGESVPVLIPASPGDMESLDRAIAALQRNGRPFLVDPILDPIHFGFVESLARYREVRNRHPDVEILMGTGNVTELTDADTSGITAVLLGIASELRIGAILTTQVSAHARAAVREADVARRLMFAAREANALPRDLHPGLLQVHERSPFPYTRAEIDELAAAVRDPSFRIQTSAEGIHIYNRDGHHTAIDPFALFPALRQESDAAHAFYLGVELARAQIAWQLGKRYVQDEQLDWGCAVPRGADDRSRYAAPGSTLDQRTDRDKS
jgi:dihydropteroate synthase-like protein